MSEPMIIEPSPEEQARRRFVEFTAETIKNTSSTDYPGSYPNEDHTWSVEKFKQNFRIEFHELTPADSSFSLVGIDASIANAFRRILLAEVPTMAIEHVFIQNNTSVVQDEVLASRLGLVPLKGNTQALKYMRWMKKPDQNEPLGSQATDYNILQLKLQVKCEWHPEGRERFKRGEREPKKLYINSNVYAKQIVWQPMGRQEVSYGNAKVEPVHPDILLVKMRPGQEIDLTMHAVKGAGGDHAKFSPVATASYRLLPAIDILRPIVGQDAKKFARCFPRGVIALKPVTEEEARRPDSGYAGKVGELRAVVADPMKDSVSRECLRHNEFKGKVRLGRVQDHFIFKVESTGQIESDDLFIDAVKLLKMKCQKMKRAMDELNP